MESPQGFWMRVAMGLSINESDKEGSAIEFYNLMSGLKYTPSTPTLFNSGTTHSQLSSCYLNTFDDSIDGIFDGVWQEARKSKFAGGLGLDVTPFRSWANSMVKDLQ
jgi:ribonucleoside-diphosphate reductase alpha chain